MAAVSEQYGVIDEILQFFVDKFASFCLLNIDCALSV